MKPIKAKSAGRVLSAAALAATGAVTMSGVAAGSTVAEPYTIPIIVDATGDYSGLSLPAVAGFRTAVGALNEEGGIDGHPVQLEVFDTTSTPDGAQAATLQAIELGAPAIFAPMISTELAANQRTFEQNGAVVFAPGGSVYLQENAYTPRWAFTFQWLTAQQVMPYVAGLKATYGDDLTGIRVAIEHYESAGIAVIIPLLEEALEAEGVEVVEVEAFAPTQTDFAGQAANLAAAELDAILMVSAGADIQPVTSAVRTAGYEGPMFVNITAAPSLLTSLEDENLFASYFFQLPDEDVLAQAEKYGESTEGSYFPQGYVMAQVMFKALEACGYPCEADAYLDAMEGLGSFEVDLSAGEITYSDTIHTGSPMGQFYHWDGAELAPWEEPFDLSVGLT